MTGKTETEIRAMLDQFAYDPDSGRVRNLRDGSYADTARSGGGYRQIRAALHRSSPILAHRFAWLVMTGDYPPRNLHIHHVNGVRDDNRWSNLRLVTPRENQAAVARRPDSGIRQHKRGRSWHVSWGTTVPDLETARVMRNHIQAAIDAFLDNGKGG